LKYQIPDDEPVYNFFQRDLYHTFMRREFTVNVNKVPIPYITVNKIRYPILSYLFFEMFILRLIYANMLEVSNDDYNKISTAMAAIEGDVASFVEYQEYQKNLKTAQEFIDLSKEKMIKYKGRSDLIKNVFYLNNNKESIDKLEREINYCIRLYQKISLQVVKCFSKDKKFSLEMNNLAECKDYRFKSDLYKFKKQMDETIFLFSKIRLQKINQEEYKYNEANTFLQNHYNASKSKIEQCAENILLNKSEMVEQLILQEYPELPSEKKISKNTIIVYVMTHLLLSMIKNKDGSERSEP